MSKPEFPTADLPSSTWTEGDLQVNSLRLHVYRAGGEKPALVLVHGYTDNALYWTRTAQALAPAWDVVMYDARGHGGSDRAGGRFNETDRVADLMGVVRALGLEKPVLIGHSMGAATCAAAAAQHPGLARALVLEDPAWYELPASLPPAEMEAYRAKHQAETEAWRAWVARLQAEPYAAGLALIQANNPGWAALDQRLSFNARRQMEIGLFDFYPPLESPWREVAPRLDLPGLLLLGDNPQRSAIVTVEQAGEIARLWRRGRWVQIPGAGHSIRYDQFDAYLAAVQGFLEEVRQD